MISLSIYPLTPQQHKKQLLHHPFVFLSFLFVVTNKIPSDLIIFQLETCVEFQNMAQNIFFFLYYIQVPFKMYGSSLIASHNRLTMGLTYGLEVEQYASLCTYQL